MQFAHVCIHDIHVSQTKVYVMYVQFAQFCSLPFTAFTVHLPQEDGAMWQGGQGWCEATVRLWQADSCDSHRMDFRFVSAKLRQREHEETV